MSFFDKILETATFFCVTLYWFSKFHNVVCYILWLFITRKIICTHINCNFCLWFFLCRFLVMIHICNFCPRKVFDSNMFLMFNRFGDNTTVYVFYDGISENYSCRSFRFWGCIFFDNYLGLDTTTILRLTCRATNQILVFIMLVFFIIYLFIP